MEEVKLPIFKKRIENLKKIGLDTEIFCFAFGDVYNYTQYNVIISTKNRGVYGKVKGFTLPKAFKITKDTRSQWKARKEWIQEQVEELFYNADLFCSAFPPEDSLRITKMIIEESKTILPKETSTSEDERSKKSFIESNKNTNDSTNNGSE